MSEGESAASAPTADPAEIEAAIDRLVAAWPTPELTEEQRAVYRDVLADIPGPAVTAAVESLLREGREERPPAGTVRERALRASGRGRWRWLPAAVLALAVAAAVVSIVIAIRTGDEEADTSLPPPDEIEQRLSDWDWGAGLQTRTVACTADGEQRAECRVTFTVGDTVRVAVTPGDTPGELVVDQAE